MAFYGTKLDPRKLYIYIYIFQSILLHGEKREHLVKDWAVQKERWIWAFNMTSGGDEKAVWDIKPFGNNYKLQN